MIYYFSGDKSFSTSTRAVDDHKRALIVKRRANRSSLIDVEKFVDSIAIGNWNRPYWLQF